MSTKNFETKIIPNFLNEQEIKDFLDAIEFCCIKESWDYSPTHFARLQEFCKNGEWMKDPDREHAPSPIEQILKPKIEHYFGEEVRVITGHILTSHKPYMLHTDARGGHGIDENNEAAWTLLIPLDNYNSHTLLFEQEAPEGEGLADHNIITKDYKWPQLNKITDEEIDDLLTDECKILLSYFSFEKVYKWRKGECFAASRKKYHSSDRFDKKGLRYKKAIILWTSIPRK